MVLAISEYLDFIVVPIIKGKNINTNRETAIDMGFTETPGNKIEITSGI